MNDVARRNYNLVEAQALPDETRQLVSADWYTTPIPRGRLKELMRRDDGTAIRDTLIWAGLLILSGTCGVLLWNTWYALVAFGIYGVLYCSVSDSRWHECGHRTAFRTIWMNDLIYEAASFMVLRESVRSRWSHARHHTDTIIVGRDPEIAAPRPPDLLGIALNLFNLKDGTIELRRIVTHAFGFLNSQEKSYIPESEYPKLIRNARIYLLIHATAITTAVVSGSLLPVVLIGLPSFYGAWLMVVFALTQHAGLAEDVLDHRLNCRTVLMNPIFRFLYWNMNYHVEHHMFPTVPYHALPALHREIRYDTPPPYHGLWDAYREIIPTLLKQRREPGYFIRRPIPANVSN